MNLKVTKDKFTSGETIWRLEVTDHSFFDFPPDYKITVECMTLDGLLKNLNHYTRKWEREFGKKGRSRKNLQHKQVSATGT